MVHIHIGSVQDSKLDSSIIDGMFKLRHEVFHDRLKWDVDSVNGREIDQYDQSEPLYIIASDELESVRGCWRLLPTTGTYMLKDTFPELLGGSECPINEHIWELSRFAVDTSRDKICSQSCLGGVTFKMIKSVYEFAVLQNITEYITVTSVAVERLMLRAGIPISRLKNSKAVRIGKVRSVACSIPINQAFRDAVYPTQSAMVLPSIPLSGAIPEQLIAQSEVNKYQAPTFC